MTTAPASAHTTVLLDEAVDALLHAAPPGAADDEQLARAADGVYVDGTFGRGGHSRLLLQRLGARARLLAIDRDPEAVAAAAGAEAQRFGVLRALHGQITGVREPGYPGAA